MASAMPLPNLELRRTLDATPERVFRAWTDLNQLRRWWGPGGFTLPEAEQDLRVGGAYRFGMRGPDGVTRWLRGEYREIRPPERLVFTWNWEADGDAAETVVSVQLFARGRQTEIVVTHGPFLTASSRDGHNLGWISTLDRLPGGLQS